MGALCVKLKRLENILLNKIEMFDGEMMVVVFCLFFNTTEK